MFNNPLYIYMSSFFFISLTSVCLFIVGAQGDLCTWSHSMTDIYTHRHTHKHRRTHTPHSVRLLWARDRLVAETPTWQHPTLTTDRHPCSAGFEPTIPASERPQTYALDGAATGFGFLFHTKIYFSYLLLHDTRKQLTHSVRQYILENTIFVQTINKFPTVIEPEVLFYSRKQTSCSIFQTRTHTHTHTHTHAHSVHLSFC